MARTGPAGGAGQSRLVTMENTTKTWPNHSFASTWPPRHLAPLATDSRPRTSHGRKLQDEAPAGAAPRPATVSASQTLAVGGGETAGRTSRSELSPAPDDRFDRLRFWADCTAVHPFYFRGAHCREGAPPRRVLG
jgi:hypothetical protein